LRLRIYKINGCLVMVAPGLRVVWALFLVGLLSVALGVAMVVLPDVGLLSLVWLVGLHALSAGVA
jgi:uncharacterized membrane protein HdeD (DUF308 family)